MATAVLNTIENNHKLIVEAGTGTGKTFAYLIPALLNKEKPLFPPVLKICKINYFNAIYPLLLKR